MNPQMLKLTPAQIEALFKFSSSGGHGFGEYSYLPRATALSLARRGFVMLGTRMLLGMGGRPRSASWAVLTAAGLEALRATGTVLAPRELAPLPYDFSPWATIPPTRRNGPRLDAKTLQPIEG
jgi:hypothetical protein